MKHRSLSRRQLLAGAAAAGVAAGLPFAALAQPTVRFVLPNATGSGIDAITRSSAPALGKALGASVVVENQPGAGGVLGLQTLARSAPDGNTLSFVSNNVVIFPSVLVVNPNKMPANNAREFFALLKAKPGAYNFGSGGSGTILHLATELVMDAAGTKATHVPYKGVGPMVGDLLGGQIDFATAALPSVQSQIKAGLLKPIGTLAPQRTPAAPEIATFAEQGLPNFAVEAWFAVIGPKGMSPAAVKKAHDAVVAAFNDPAVKEAQAKMGNTIHISTPEQAEAAFRSELAKYAALVKKVGLQPQ